VDLRLGAAADVARVLGEAPEVAVVATGARAFRPNLPGLEDYGFSAWEVLQGTEVPGNDILVIDEEYGHQGLSVAERLLDQGKRVRLVTSERTVGSHLGSTTIPPVLQRLFRKGIQMHFSLRVTQLEANRAIARNVWSEQEEVLEPFDGFVYAYGGEAVCDLYEALQGKVARVELIGDSFAPRSLQHAILEGHKFAREI